jgi:uncharacterized protein (TIGR03790 family)
MVRRWCWLLGLFFFWSFPASIFAGGSGLNVVVIVNQNSTNSVQLGNYYCEQRQVPPQNLLRTSWAGGNVQWTKTDFETVILNPLLAMLAARQLTNQIDYVVLSMDFPYLVSDASGINGTTSELFYGFKTDGGDSCSLPTASKNAYAGSEGIFRSTPPTSANSNSFLVTMITSSNLAQAKLVVDRGVASDFSFPTQTVYLAKSSDFFRNIRYATFDNAIFNTRLRGNYSMQRTNLYSPDLPGPSLGYENGVQKVTVPPNLFVPGAMADELTSYGGRIYDVSDHTTALEFLNAGASGSYGTVVEPCAYLEKFPSPQNYFYQARGFSLAECYYQSLTNPFQGIVIGEPLAAPFAQPASGGWSGLPTNALLSGTTNLTLQATANDAQHPVQQVDLFLDGNFVRTITNIPPSPNNTLNVTINGTPASYVVPAGATIRSIASNLTFQINQPAISNVTKVQASTHGDRIELQSLDISRAGSQVTVSAGSSSGGAPLTTFAAASRASFLDTVAYGIRPFSAVNTPQNGDFLRLTITKTNGAVVVVSVTNTPGGATISSLAQQLVDLLNNTASLQGPDGVVAEDFIGYDPYGFQEADFNLRARSAGWNAAQVQVALSGSATFSLTPAGANRLDDNLPDLRPRNHLYVTAGLTSLPLTFAFDSTAQADGYHELTAVGYEGSHVRTQKRFSQNVRIQNSLLSAVFATVVGAETALDSVLQFSVTANTNNISKIELFSTGGSLGSVTGQSTANFSVTGTNLGVGLHPFYALVTASTGKQYRTDTKWIRLSTTAVAPFALSITAPPPTLTWPAVAGRRYDILSSTNIAIPFQLRASITASSSVAQWTETNPAAPRRFYRVQTAN